MLYAQISGTGAYLPEKILTNYDLEKIVDTSHDWIVERSGIQQRHIASDDETSATMAHAAAKMALKNAGISAADLDLIIVATCSGENIFPSTACQLQQSLSAKKAAAFDVSAACSGFIFALTTASQYIETGMYRNILVVGSEVMSRVIDWQDRSTCVLFGDGAGAVVLTPADKPGILGCDLNADGNLGDILFLKNLQNDAKIHMLGREVFKQAVGRLTDSSRGLLTKCQVAVDEVDWVVPHQANLRIIRMVMSKLKLKLENVIVTVDDQANTSAASIPLALHTGIADGRIQRNQTLLLEAFGGGLTWGGVLIRY